MAAPFDAAFIITGMSQERVERAKCLLAEPEFAGVPTFLSDCIKGRDYLIPPWFRDLRDGQIVGAFGCWWSHLLTLCRGLSSPADSFLVLEDDVVFKPHWDVSLSEAVAELPAEWHALYLGVGHFHRRELVPFSFRLRGIRGGGTTHAILWSRAGAQRALEALWADPVAADICLNQLKVSTPTFVCWPPIAGQAGKLISSITGGVGYAADTFWEQGMKVEPEG
jgi:GR25 family glycosyltransferase involved in LPS biosynthesis